MISISRITAQAVDAIIVPVASVVLGSFKTKLITLVVLSVLVPSSVIWVFTIRDTESFQTDQIREKFSVVLSDARKDINYWYKDRIGDLQRLLQSKVFLQPLDSYVTETRSYEKTEIKKYFSIVREKFPVYEKFVVLNKAGETVLSSSAVSESEAALLDSLHLQVGRQPFISQEYMTSDMESVLQWIAVPVELPSGACVTVCARIDLTDMGGFLATTTLSPRGDLYLLDVNGNYITQPRNAPIDPDNQLPVNMRGRPASNVRRGVRADASPVVDRYTKTALSEDGAKPQRATFLTSEIFLAERNWWLVCEDEESQIIAPVVTRKNKLMMANFLICALFVLAAWKMSSRLLKPLAELSLGARRINDGMAGVQIPGGGMDEIGHMINAFNDMAKRISVTEAKLNYNNKELEKRNKELVGANNKLAELSITDGLTGLFNHRHFWNLLNSELTRTNLYQGELGLILLDVDDFKTVNDQFGHASGDLLIQKIARTIKDSVRETDLVARYGGEELAVLLPDTSRNGVMNVSEKVRRAVEEMVFKVPSTDITISVTISIGVSVFRGNRREFFNAADRALYQSKSEGKNRVNFVLSAAESED